MIKQIKKDLLVARKTKNKFVADKLTALISEINMVGKNNGNRDTTTEEAIKVVTKFKKGVNDTIDLLLKNGADSKEVESFIEEVSLYDEYLPKQLSETELRELLIRWKEDNYPDNPSMVGFMQALKRVYPNQYDGKLASKILREIL